MDLNGDMELDNYEMIIGNVYEGANLDNKMPEITEEMASNAIKNRLSDNHKLTRSVNLAVYDLVRKDLKEYDNSRNMGR